jgi:hypothetical protein
MNVKGFGRKCPWPDMWYYSGIGWDRVSHKCLGSRWPIYGYKSESAVFGEML